MKVSGKVSPGLENYNGNNANWKQSWNFTIVMEDDCEKGLQLAEPSSHIQFHSVWWWWVFVWYYMFALGVSERWIFSLIFHFIWTCIPVCRTHLCWCGMQSFFVFCTSFMTVMVVGKCNRKLWSLLISLISSLFPFLAACLWVAPDSIGMMDMDLVCSTLLFRLSPFILLYFLFLSLPLQLLFSFFMDYFHRSNRLLLETV